MIRRIPLLPLSHWALPLILATSLGLFALPSRALAADFSTSFRGLGGYALLRQGDIAGAGEFFRSAFEQNQEDPLILQGMAEVAIFERDVVTLQDCRHRLTLLHATESLSWLTAREAHTAGQWAAALAGYSAFLDQPAWTAAATDAIQAIHLKLGNLPFRAVIAGLGTTNPEAATAINRLNGSWTQVAAERPAPQPWEAQAYVAAHDLPTIEQAVRAFWAERQESAASSLLAAAAERHPRDARVQSLLKEQLLIESNHLPVPPAKRRLPAGAMATTWAGESGWEFAGLMPSDMPLGGPLAAYWEAMDATFAVSEGYYSNLLGEFEQLKSDIEVNVQTRSAGKLMQNIAHFNTLVEGAITMSEREIQTTNGLPVPQGFQAFAAKLLEYQNLRTAAFADLRQLIRTQNTDYADAARAKADQLQPLAEEAVSLFMQAYARSPIEWKTPPEPEVTLEDEGTDEGSDGELKAEAEMSDGERLYGPEFDFDIPEDGDIEPIDEG